jgi:hypothetical protein
MLPHLVVSCGICSRAQVNAPHFINHYGQQWVGCPIAVDDVVCDVDAVQPDGRLAGDALIKPAQNGPVQPASAITVSGSREVIQVAR